LDAVEAFRLKSETTRLAERTDATELAEVISFGAMDGATPFDDLLAEPGTPPAVAIAPDDVVALPYSSGTTGMPKGVMLTHRNLIANILQTDGTGHLRDGADTLICFLPFFHIYGLVVIMLLGLRSGATLVVMPRFELERYLDLVERHRATMLHVVPPVVLALAKSPAAGGRDYCVLQQAYGLTETSPTTHATSEDPATNKPGSIGVPIANTECRVVDPATGVDAGVGEDGEIWIRGPQVMRGYLNCPEATRATIDADGWLHTGDIGHADSDGHFFVVDRLKELIKYKGMQVAPAELEAALLAHPAVADAAVVPRQDDAAGEIPHAFVVLKGAASADELMTFVAARVASYKKIRGLEFIDAIPKSPSGKILRRVLRDRLAIHG
jgi:acyl-CoA synthetase (AMP-forming)/AMP-acid ligase II